MPSPRSARPILARPALWPVAAMTLSLLGFFGTVALYRHVAALVAAQPPVEAKP